MSTTPKDRSKSHRAARRRKAKRRREDMLCRMEALMDRFERAVKQAELAASRALSRFA